MNWEKCRSLYDWTVNLSNFRSASLYPGYFEDVITPQKTQTFENRFRDAVNDDGNNVGYLVAAEVIYWKNFGAHMARDKLTERLIDQLQPHGRWQHLCNCIKSLEGKQKIFKFESLLQICGQPKGFATPITFLAFYRPEDFPMVDKHIAYWWKANKTRFRQANLPNFIQRKDGWIEGTTEIKREHNWNSYLAWKRFCCKQAEALTVTIGRKWRARDVEIAVWESQKRGIPVEVI